VELTLSDQGSVRARTVVVASGARYKRPPVTNLRLFEGDSVHYWASPVEAKLCTDEEIILVGAGNSAGQAIVFLAPLVKRLTVLVRGKGLEASMSRYLIDRIKSLDNVDIHVRSELIELHGDPVGALESATVRNNATGPSHASRSARSSCLWELSPTQRGSTERLPSMTRDTF
jgi:thioredoxin reductase (NADPH)